MMMMMIQICETSFCTGFIDYYGTHARTHTAQYVSAAV